MTANQINFRKAQEEERANKESERIRSKANEIELYKTDVNARIAKQQADAATLKAQADAYNAKLGKGMLGDLQRLGNTIGESVDPDYKYGVTGKSGSVRKLKLSDVPSGYGL